MKEFKDRRKKLAQMLPKKSVLVLPSLPEFYRQPDVTVPYRQDSQLYYLTGYLDSQACLVVTKTKSLFFVAKRDLKKELWEGKKASPLEAQKKYLMDEAWPLEDMTKILAKHLKSCDTIFDSQVCSKTSQELRKFKKKIEPSASLLGKCRLIKDSVEIKHLKKACLVTCNAHKELARALRPGVSERALHGTFLKSLMEQNSIREGYQSIVGSGINATVLHYIKNQATCKRGELLLVDAAGEWKHYTADVTRVYPVSGRFSKDQRIAYELLLSLQKKLIQMVKPGESFENLNKVMREGLTDILIKLKIIRGSSALHMKKRTFLKYCAHSVGHFLGLDVHDPGFIGKKAPIFKENMVITIEPGIYFPKNDKNVPSSLRSVGMRIEDDILITQKAGIVLSKSLPKEVDEIEQLVQA